MAWVNLLDAVYPTGSVYLSATDISPAQLIGGTWEKIEDRFIRAAVSPSVVGGSDTHQHTYGVDWITYYSSIANYNQQGRESYLGLWDDSQEIFTSGAITQLSNVSNAMINGTIARSQVEINGTIKHYGTTMTMTADNIPKYYTVCMWVRTA